MFLLVLTFVPIVYLAGVGPEGQRPDLRTFLVHAQSLPLGELRTGLGGHRVDRLSTRSSRRVRPVQPRCCCPSLSGYVFARHRFPAKEIIYTGILALLMIPPILTLIPAYVLILNMGLENTYWALILPWTSGGQVFALLLCRSFFATLPEEFFDAARIDAARPNSRPSGGLQCPLSIPILVTVAVVRLVTTYNQFMWPLVAISSP